MSIDCQLSTDAFVAPQGRPEDLMVAATNKLFDNFGIHTGYHYLEGRADHDAVYNFALFHYDFVGISYTLKNKT